MARIDVWTCDLSLSRPVSHAHWTEISHPNSRMRCIRRLVNLTLKVLQYKQIQAPIMNLMSGCAAVGRSSPPGTPTPFAQQANRGTR